MSVENSLSNKKTNTKFSSFVNNNDVKQNITSILGSKSGTFIASIVSAVNSNVGLQECTSKSILNGALLGEALNLLPSPQLGQYYLIPFANKSEKGESEKGESEKVAQFQLGYKGYIQLAIRSGQYKKLNTLAIKEGELIRFNSLDEEIEVNLIEDYEERENAQTIGYYAMFEYHNGFKKAIYWSRKRMEAHAKKYSSAYKNDLGKEHGNSYWSKDFDGMAIKTMLKQLISKWGCMSIEMARAIEADMSVIKNISPNSIEAEYVDNIETGVDRQIKEVSRENPNTVSKGTKKYNENIEDDFFNSSAL